MSRRRSTAKRPITPDPVYKEEMVTRFICSMMKQGKRSSAEKQFYGALTLIEKKGPRNFGDCANSLGVFKQAVENTKPMLEVKSRRVGGSNYQVPIEVRPERRQALAYRWLIEFARKRPGRSMMERLSAEIMDAAMQRGSAVKRREDVHKMAEANKAFAHYRW